MAMTGSHSYSPCGALFFQPDGSLELHVSDTCSDIDKETMTMATDFFQYAVCREDWIRDFLCEFPIEDGDLLEEPAFSKDDLSVIPGGLIHGSMDDDI